MNVEVQALHEIEQKHYELLLEADPSKKLVDEYLARSFCFEARKNKQLVGILVLLTTRPMTLEIMNIAIQKEYRGQKFGQQLLLFAITFAKENQYKLLEIGTGTTSFVQLYLYQKYGFRITHVESDFFIKYYEKPIFENGFQLKDRIHLSQSIQ